MASRLSSIVGLGWPGVDAAVWDDEGDPRGRLIGVSLVLATTSSDDRAVVTDLIVAQLGAAGADVQVVTDEPGRFFGETVLPGFFEVGEWAWLSEPGGGGVARDFVNWFWTDAPEGLISTAGLLIPTPRSSRGSCRGWFRWSRHPTWVSA